MEFSESLNEQIKKLQDELDVVKKELNIQKEEYNKLKHENEQQDNIMYNQNITYEIMQYLYKSDSIKKTAEHFGSDIKYLYSKISTWGDCSEALNEREDYHDYREKLSGRKCEIAYLEFLQDDIKMRTPGKEKLHYTS